MNSEQLPRDVLVAARKRVALAQRELDAARRKATALAERMDWLADRPDLQQVWSAFREAVRRSHLFRQLTDSWIRARIRALSPRWSKGNRAVDKVIDAYHHLRRHLAAGQGRKSWPELIRTILRLDDALDSADVALLGDILRAESARAEIQRSISCGHQLDAYIAERIDAFVHAETAEFHAALETYAKLAADARSAIVAQFRQKLEQGPSDPLFDDFVPEDDDQLGQELVAIQHEELERRWWEHFETQPLEAIRDRLDNVLPNCAGAVLRRLLTMSATDSRIHDAKVQAFFGDRCHSLLGSPEIVRPLFVAYLARLIAESRIEGARAILDRTPNVPGSPLENVVAYLRFLTATPRAYNGETRFDTLVPSDMFLAACYYKNNPASRALDSQSEWDYESVKSALEDVGSRALNDYKVDGLQPRIAELAFQKAYRRLHGDDAARLLTDLNLEHVQTLARPWLRTRRGCLPAADWKDGEGNEYDVKCNLYYPSKEPKIGLRGFLIEDLKRDRGRSFPGIVFSNKTDDSCAWVYVGEYQPAEARCDDDDRVLPFFFRLPASESCALPTSGVDVDLGLYLLRYHRLRVGWLLAARQRRPQPREDVATKLLYEWADRSVTIAANTYLEYALWKALTETALDACVSYSNATVRAFLEQAGRVVAGGTLPIRLPQIGGGSLLNRWISEVLDPIAANWHRIRRPNCGCRPGVEATVKLQLTRLTAGGCILGRVGCPTCGRYMRNEVTILTNCYGDDCHRYPLIIGINETCEQCGGLVCECGRCKSDTCNGRKRRPTYAAE